MKPTLIILITILIISCERNENSPIKPKLTSIYQDTLLEHHFEYDTQNRITRFYTHSYHYHIDPMQQFWTTNYEFLEFEYIEGKIIKILRYAQNGENLNDYELIEYNKDGLPIQSKLYTNSNMFMSSTEFKYDAGNKLMEIINSNIDHIYFEYINNNVSKMTLYYSYTNTRIVCNFEYDDKKNPLSNLGIICSSRRYGNFLNSEFISKNNITKITVEQPEGIIGVDNSSYIYKYNDLGVPIWRKDTLSNSYTTFFNYNLNDN